MKNVHYLETEDLSLLIQNAVAKVLEPVLGISKVDLDEIVGLSEAAKILHLAEVTIRKKVISGKLKKACPDVRGLRFTRRELKRYAENYRP